MSPRDWHFRIQDILTSSHNIQEFTAGMNFDSFLDDPKTIRAVAFELTRLGKQFGQFRKIYKTNTLKSPGGKFRVFEMFWFTNTSVWMKKFYGKPYRMKFQD